VPVRHLRPQEPFLRRYETEPRELACTAAGPAEWRLWRDRLRGKLIDLLGLPRERGDLDPEILEEVQRDGYRRQKILLQTRPYVSMPVHVLIPDGLSGPAPVVLASHGHGSGAVEIIGEPRTAEEARHIAELNYDYARQAVRQGYLVIAPEQFAFGERREPAQIEAGLMASSCRPAAFWAQMLGQTVIGMRVWDALRCLDYLETRPEADMSRVAMIGLSGGGTVTTFTAALEERLKVAVISGYFCQWRASILAMPHCECNYVPGILRYVECGDLAGLIAPRPLLISAGDRDPIFPLAGVREAFSTAERIYSVLGVRDRLELEVFSGQHVWSSARVWDFLREWL